MKTEGYEAIEEPHGKREDMFALNMDNLGLPEVSDVIFTEAKPHSCTSCASSFYHISEQKVTNHNLWKYPDYLHLFHHSKYNSDTYVAWDTL